MIGDLAMGYLPNNRELLRSLSRTSASAGLARWPFQDEPNHARSTGASARIAAPAMTAAMAHSVEPQAATGSLGPAAANSRSASEGTCRGAHVMIGAAQLSGQPLQRSGVLARAMAVDERAPVRVAHAGDQHTPERRRQARGLLGRQRVAVADEHQLGRAIGPLLRLGELAGHFHRGVHPRLARGKGVLQRQVVKDVGHDFGVGSIDHDGPPLRVEGHDAHPRPRRIHPLPERPQHFAGPLGAGLLAARPRVGDQHARRHIQGDHDVPQRGGGRLVSDPG